MPDAPLTITLTPASAPAAPSTITKSAAGSSDYTLILTGTLSPDITGTYEKGSSFPITPDVVKDSHYRDADLSAPMMIWDDTGSEGLGWYAGDPSGTDFWFSDEDVQFAFEVETWTPIGGATGDLTVAYGSGLLPPRYIERAPAAAPSAPSTITKSAASAPSAPSTITKSAASAPSAPDTIAKSAASAPSAPDTISKTAASAPSAPTTITLSAASQPAAPGIVTP